MKTSRRDCIIHTYILTMVSISLFYFCEKVLNSHDWEKFNQTSLPEKYYFYSHLSMEDISDQDNTQDRWHFLNKKFRWISWFLCSKQYIIFNWCIWELSKYVSWNIWTQSCTRISMASNLKKTKVKLDLLTDISTGRER